MSRSSGQRAGGVNIWTIVQLASILVWIAGFVVAFYFVSFSKQPATVKQNGQLAGMVITGIAYLAVIFSMIKHSPDQEQ